MKKICMIVFIFTALVLSAHTKPKTMFVCVKEAQIKTGTGFFAKTAGIVKYAEKVSVIEDKGKWVKVTVPSRKSLSGWILKTSLTRKKLIANNNSKTSANTKELALAGKGLTEGSGNEFKTKGAKNYQAVQFVEEINIKPTNLQKFIVSGKLKEGE